MAVVIALWAYWQPTIAAGEHMCKFEYLLSHIQYEVAWAERLMIFKGGRELKMRNTVWHANAGANNYHHSECYIFDWQFLFAYLNLRRLLFWTTHIDHAPFHKMFG